MTTLFDSKPRVKSARKPFALGLGRNRAERLPVGPSALGLAQAAFAERQPDGTLDPVRLGVLSDALEEAGCTDEAILSHLRGPGPHVRGCWALDLVLGRN